MNGKHLNNLLKINALHALYREDGKWYHHLKKFPGVLFDKSGYIIFLTKKDYENNPFLIRQNDLHISKGISSLSGYTQFTLKELKEIKNFSKKSNKLEVSDKAWGVFVSIAEQAQKNNEIFHSPIRGKNYIVESVDNKTVFVKRESGEGSEIKKDFFLRVINDLNQNNGRIGRREIKGHVSKISAIVYLHPQLEWADNFETIVVNKLLEQNLIEKVKSDLDSFEEENSDNFEGGKKKRLINHYERKPRLRAEAILIHGTSCLICKFNFKEHYGEHGEDYIEVHHLVPLSKLIDPAEVNPKTDMVVLCANCHRMIHRNKNNLLSIEHLSKIWSETRVVRVTDTFNLNENTY